MRRRLPDLALDAWPALLALLLCLPLLTHAGHPLARDLVFVPHQPWTDAVVGLGDAAPRAVPLDALVSVITSVVDGGVLARVVLPLVLALAGWGAHRMLGDLGLVARLSAGGLAVWNPFTVERLALGQWALLAAYAALPWLVVAARRHRSSGRWRDLAAVTAWLGLASITPTGGVLGVLAALVVGAGRAGGAGRTARLVAVCVLLQLPWLVPSLVGGAAATSDPAGVDAFSAGAEGPGGVLTALVGLGGIWDAGSVPATRNSWWATVTAVVVVAALVAGRRVLVQVLGRGDAARLAWLGGAGLALALLSSVPGGGDLVRRLVEEVPGAGLLRDSQKFLAPFALLVTLAVGATVHRVVAAVGRHGVEVVAAVALVAVPLPLLLLPDAAASTWDTVRPVDYPAGLDRVAALVDAGPGQAAVATLPWRSYRAFRWGNGLVSSDPAVRWLDRDVVVDDDLLVGRTRVRGEDLRSRALGLALRREGVAAALRGSRVTWALVYRDDPRASGLDLAGLRRVYADRDLALYRVPGVVGDEPGPAAAASVLVGVVDVLALLAVLAAVGCCVAARPRHGRTRAEDPAVGSTR